MAGTPRALETLSCRPPFSLGVFNQQQMQDIVDWMLATYYKHYKLYQYAFTTRYAVGGEPWGACTAATHAYGSRACAGRASGLPACPGAHACGMAKWHQLHSMMRPSLPHSHTPTPCDGCVHAAG